jgi:hypothetical protein
MSTRAPNAYGVYYVPDHLRAHYKITHDRPVLMELKDSEVHAMKSRGMSPPKRAEPHVESSHWKARAAQVREKQASQSVLTGPEKYHSRRKEFSHYDLPTGETLAVHKSIEKGFHSSGAKDLSGQMKWLDDNKHSGHNAFVFARAEKKASQTRPDLAHFVNGLSDHDILSDPHFDPHGGFSDGKDLRMKYTAYSSGDKKHWAKSSHKLHAQVFGMGKTASLCRQIAGTINPFVFARAEKKASGLGETTHLRRLALAVHGHEAALAGGLVGGGIGALGGGALGGEEHKGRNRMLGGSVGAVAGAVGGSALRDHLRAHGIADHLHPHARDLLARPGGVERLHSLRHAASRSKATAEDLDRAGKIMSKRYGVKVGSLCRQIAGTINPSDFARFEELYKEAAVAELIPRTPCVQESLGHLLSQPMVSGAEMLQKAASLQRAPTAVVQLRPHGYGYILKTAAAPEGTAPKEQKVSKEQAQQALPQQMLDTADQQGVATTTEVQADPDPLTETPQPIQGFGMYKVFEAGTGKQLVGYVIPGLFDPMQGTNSPMQLFFNGGQFALQPEINGVMVALSYNLPEAQEARGMGIFYKTDGRSIIATVPYNVATKVTVEGREYYSATTQDGQEVQLTMSDGLQKPVATSPQEIAIPADFSFLALDGPVQLDGVQEQPQQGVPGDPTGGAPAPQQAAPAQEKAPAQPAAPQKQEVKLNGGTGLQGQPAQDPTAAAKQAAAPSMCEIRAWANEGGPGGGVRLSGPVFSKHGSGEYNWADGIFWLAATGMPQNLSMACIEKAASTGSVVRMYGLRQLSPHNPGLLKSAAAEAVASLVGRHIPERPCLLKEALAIGHNKEARTLVGTDAIDNLLALNFLNPENVQTFVDNLPHFEETASKLAGLVFATQLGLQSVPKEAAVRAMECLEGVIKGLKALQDYKL